MFKRDGVWYARFRIQGKLFRISTGEADRAKAKAIAARLKLKYLADAGNLDIVEREKLFTVRDMFARWEREHFPTLEPSSVVRHRISINALLPFFGDKPLAEVTEELVHTYRTHRLQEVEPATYNREYDALKSAFGYAVRRWKWLPDNPMSGIKKERENNFITRWLTADEERLLLESAPEWLQDIILFLIHTGLRREECLSLKWDKVDLQNRVIHILKVTRTKNRAPRTIPLNEAAFRIAQKQSANGNRCAKYLFPSDTGTKINGPNMGRSFRVALTKSGIAHCRIHDLRHTFASRLVQRGVDIHAVARLLGVSVEIAAKRYAHLSVDSLRGSVAALDLSETVNFSIPKVSHQKSEEDFFEGNTLN